MLSAPAIRRALPVAALLALGACAALQQPPPPRDPSLLSAQPPPAGRVCRVLPEPEELPPVAALVDSLPLHEAVGELQREREIAEGYVILSLAYDSFGINIRRAVIEHDLSPAIADSVQKLVFAHRRQLEPGEELGVRLRIDLGEEVRMRVGRQEFCQARPRDLAILSPYSVTRERAPTTSMRDETVWVRVFLDASGSVASARVERGILGALWEEQLFNYVRMIAFDPALVDGYAVPGNALVPVVVRRR